MRVVALALSLASSSLPCVDGKREIDFHTASELEMNINAFREVLLDGKDATTYKKKQKEYERHEDNHQNESATVAQGASVHGYDLETGSLRLVASHRHLDPESTNKLWSGLCACTSNEPEDVSNLDLYYQFKNSDQCLHFTMGCYKKCWHWRIPTRRLTTLSDGTRTEVIQIRPTCLVVDSGESVDLTTRFSKVAQYPDDTLEEGETWIWKEAPMPDVRQMYYWGLEIAKTWKKQVVNVESESVPYLQTWKYRAGVFTATTWDADQRSWAGPEVARMKDVPTDKALEGTCICANGYFIPFLDLTKKYGVKDSQSQCSQCCLSYCQTLKTSESVRALQLRWVQQASASAREVFEDSPRHAWCVGPAWKQPSLAIQFLGEVPLAKQPPCVG